jgi:predicted nucleic acid-binding protein
VLQRGRFGFEATDVAALLALIDASAIHVHGALLAERLPDQDDEPFLEVAIAGKADALVTGNVRHFPARLAHGMRIVSPVAFVASRRG